MYFVRFSITDAKGRSTRRRVVVAKGKNGRFVKKGKFILEHHC